MPKLLGPVAGTLLIILVAAPQAYSYPVNLSLNPTTTATASSINKNQPWNFPEMAIDGDVTTGWNARIYSGWLEVDLADLYYVNNIFLISHDSGIFVGTVMYYNLYTSQDLINWTDIVTGGSLVDSSDPIAVGDDLLIEDNVRSVRFEVYGGNRWAHLVEMEIWGNPAPIPAPSTLLLLASELTGLVVFRKKFNEK